MPSLAGNDWYLESDFREIVEWTPSSCSISLIALRKSRLTEVSCIDSVPLLLVSVPSASMIPANQLSLDDTV